MPSSRFAPSAQWRRILPAWGLGLAIAATAAAQAALPPGVERVTSVEGITEYRLANGMRTLQPSIRLNF